MRKGKLVGLAAEILAAVLPRRLMTHPAAFRAWERHGYHIVPNDFYQVIPDLRELSAAIWATPSQCVGLTMNEDAQAELLRQYAQRYREEYESFPNERTDVPHQYFVRNDFFQTVEAEMLWCMIRHFRPKRVYEIGSGFSTYLAAEALQKNAAEDPAYDFELRVIDPYPNEVIAAGFRGLTELTRRPVQELPLSFFDPISANDVLLIDSSHVARVGSDVLYEILELIPRLPVGALVHHHDIFIPWEYPRDNVLDELLFWNEQYLLQAFLTFNVSFEVLWASNFMSKRHPDLLARAFKSYVPGSTRTSSMWIRRIT